MIYMDNDNAFMYALILFKRTQKILTYAYKKTNILKFIDGCWCKHSIKRLLLIPQKWCINVRHQVFNKINTKTRIKEYILDFSDNKSSVLLCILVPVTFGIFICSVWVTVN